MASPLMLAHLCRFALSRSLFAPTALAPAIERLGFVQADPLRAPARAQDLTLRHRVAGYRAGDLDRAYPALEVEEDFFVNYGFLPRAHQALMHPRVARHRWSKSTTAKARAVLDFVRERGTVHPRAVEAHFNHGKVRNWFGGTSNASTELLDGMHYRGLLRVARREGGTRVYGAREPWPDAGGRAACRSRLDALVDLAVALYAPLPAAALALLVRFLRGAAPQWERDRTRALAEAKRRLAHARVDGCDVLAGRRRSVPHGGCAGPHGAPARALRSRGLGPRSIRAFLGLALPIRGLPPAAKRQLGHYSLPLLWREQVVGWANIGVRDARMQVEVGFAGPRITDPAFAAAMDEELHRMHAFLGLT